MDVKVAIGVGSTTLVPRVPNIDLYSTGPGGPNDNPVYEGTVGGRSRATFSNWGMQLGARITAGKMFGEMAIGFSRFYFEVGDELALIARLEGNPLPEEILNQQARMNQLEIPFDRRLRPLQEPLLQALPLWRLGQHLQPSRLRRLRWGTAKRSNSSPRTFRGIRSQSTSRGCALGTQFDLGPLNFDFNYTIGMNSITKTSFRTNSHVFKFFLGWLF